MKNNKISVGIIGVGQIGKKHLDNYKSIPDVEVRAIAGRDPGRTENVSRDYQIPYWTTDYRELIAREDIDAVDICLHNNLHLPVTIAALKAGKHVFCEKPMAGSYKDAEAMQQAAVQFDRKLSIQLWDLFMPETRAARELIQSGLLGRPYYACSAGFRRRNRPYVDGYGTRDFVDKSQAGGGALFDMGVYHIANILYLLDNPGMLRVSGRTYQETPIDTQRLAESHYDVEEFAVGLVQLEGNITLNIVEAWAIHLDTFGGSYINGPTGGVRIKPFGVYHSTGDLDLDATANLDTFIERQRSLKGFGNAYDGPQEHWIAALLGRVPLIPTVEIALNTMLISEGIYLSEKLGREVTKLEIIDQSVSTAIEP